MELPDCAPTKVLPQDLSKVINGIEIQKHYASDLFDVKEDEIIPYELFQRTNPSDVLIDSGFITKIIGLLA